MKKEEFRNLPIGEVFEFEGKTFRVEKASPKKGGWTCEGCSFETKTIDCYGEVLNGRLPECIGEDRKDKKNVIFKEVEKK